MTKRLSKYAKAAWPAITPIFTISDEGEAKLVGTGFFITRTGVLLTAKHVLEGNIDATGKDKQFIAALQFYGRYKYQIRPLRHSSFHTGCDLALSETAQFRSGKGRDLATPFLPLTLEIPEMGTPIATHSYHDTYDEALRSEARVPLLNFSNFRFRGEVELNFGVKKVKKFDMPFSLRATTGYVGEFFPYGLPGLPFPCFRSDLPLYIGSSGGPVIDHRGRVFAVNCSRLDGSQTYYHTYIGGVVHLDLRHTLVDGDREPGTRRIGELGKHGLVVFDPKLPENQSYEQMWISPIRERS